MENQNIQNQINIIQPIDSKKNMWGKFVVFFIIEILSLIFFAIYAKDNGNWEFLRFFLAFPVFIGIGIGGLVSSIKFLRKKERGVLVWLLLLSSLIFISYFPALEISVGIQNLIFYKEYTSKLAGDNAFLITKVSKLNSILSEPRTVIDVNKNYLLLQSSKGEIFLETPNPSGNFYSIVYLPNVKDINKFETYAKTSLIGKEITALVDENELRKSNNHLKDSNEGIVMIEKVPELMQKINTRQSEGVGIDNYSIHQITLDSNFESDIPVNIYLNGGLLSF